MSNDSNNFEPAVNFVPLDNGGGFSSNSTPEKPQPNSSVVPQETSNIVPGPNGTVMKGGAMQSPNFALGVSGWKIDANGDVEFNDGTFRGALSATTIDIGGSDATSFHVDINGNLWLGAATFAAAPFSVSNAGALIATGATINGSAISGQVFYGNGGDGPLTVSGTTTLSTNAYPSSVTVDAGGILNTAGFQIFCSGTLTNNGTIRRNGSNGGNGGDGGLGTAGTSGAAGAALAAGTLAGAVAGTLGGDGATTDVAGNPGGNGGNITDSAGVAGVAGGQGGRGNAAGNATAGTVGSRTAAVSGTKNISEATVLRNSLSTSFNQITASTGSTGGGGGGGQSGGGGNGGGGAGGGATGGGVVAIYARTIVNAGTISANGGTGGNGGNGYNVGAINTGGGGGGGGGSGGVLVLVYRSLTNTGTISVAGGAGGTGGALGGSGGAGTAGANGTNGSTGTLIQLQE